MTIVVEDGSGTSAAANSYAATSDLVAYAALRQATLTTDVPTQETLLIKAMDYLERLNYKGFKFKQFQPLKWPRYDVIIDGWPLLLNQIPTQLVQAQCCLAVEYQAIELMPTAQPWDHGSVMSDNISGAVSEAYSDNARVIYVAAVEKAMRFIQDIVRREGLVGVRV